MELPLTNSIFLTKENFVRLKPPINSYHETSRHIQENNLECILSIEPHLSPPIFFVARSSRTPPTVGEKGPRSRQQALKFSILTFIPDFRFVSEPEISHM